MNIPKCPETDCGISMVPLSPTFCQYETVVWVCNIHKHWFVDEDAAARNEKIVPVRHTDAPSILGEPAMVK